MLTWSSFGEDREARLDIELMDALKTLRHAAADHVTEPDVWLILRRAYVAVMQQISLRGGQYR